MEAFCTVLHDETGKVIGLHYPKEFKTTQTFFELLQFLDLKAPYFSRYELILAVPISFEVACLLSYETNISKIIDTYPFLKLVINEDFPNLINGRKNRLLDALCNRYDVWLGNLASGTRTNMVGVLERCFEGLILDTKFTEENSGKAIFPVLVKEVSKYTNRVLIPGVSSGRYQQVRLRHVEHLI